MKTGQLSKHSGYPFKLNLYDLKQIIEKVTQVLSQKCITSPIYQVG
jgi:hypothetical protein